MCVCVPQVSLHNTQLIEDTQLPPPTLLMPPRSQRAAAPPSASDDHDLAYSLSKVRYGRPLEIVSGGAQLLGLAGKEEADRMRAGGEAAIIEEFERADASSGGWREREYGWSELEWCIYLSASKGEPVVTSAGRK